MLIGTVFKQTENAADAGISVRIGNHFVNVVRVLFGYFVGQRYGIIGKRIQAARFFAENAGIFVGKIAAVHS